jgi:hypothetical protein
MTKHQRRTAGKLLRVFVGVVVGLFVGMGVAQQKVKEQGISLPHLAIHPSDDPIVIESIAVSNDINMQYTVRVKNNTSQPIPLKQLKIEITHLSPLRNWDPSPKLLQPSDNSEIPPSQTMELKYRCSAPQETVLQQLDMGVLVYNGSNNVLVEVQFMGRWYSHRSTFIWKPKLADLRINDVKLELLHEDSAHWFRFTVVIENVGDALPILLKTTGKTSETYLLNVSLVRRKDGKEKQYKAFPEVKSERERSFDIYFDSYLRLNPGEKKELVFQTGWDSLGDGDLLHFIGEFEVTVGFDSPAWKTNSEYPYVISDANRRNNVMTKTVSLGGDCFEIISFFPEKISRYKPAGGAQGEFPRREQNLMYLKLRSYLPLTLLDDPSDFKVYFNDEELRIFNVTGDPQRGIYRVWIEKPEKRERGRFKVNILGVSRSSNKFLEVETAKFTPAPASPKLPYYFESPAPPVPLPYTISPDKFPYGVMPISIEGVSIREKDGKVNVGVALKARDYTWLERGKGWSDVRKDNPNADLSKYVSSLASTYQVYLLMRPKDKLRWRHIGKLISPKTLEANKREVVTFTLDEVKALLEKTLTSGENEFLVVVTYTFTEREGKEVEEIEVPSDMYWGNFTLGK